jgi:tetratricopeptide (TPR) repeat protein
LSTQSDSARAIELGHDGVTLYEQGKWNEALERFRAAEALYHSPVFVLYTARSLRNAGRLLEAREALKRLVGEKLDSSAPELWRKAQNDGREELKALETNISSVIITLDNGSPQTRTTIDDRPVTAGVVIELDPGTHRAIAVDAADTKSVTFTLAPGTRRQRVAIQLTPSQSPPPGATGSELSGRRSLYVPGLIVASVGGAAMLAGGVIGVLALQKKADVRDNLPASCDGTMCPRSSESEVEGRIDAARNLGTAADIFLIGGAAVAATGVGLLIFGPSDRPTATAGMSPRGGFVRVRF